VLKKSSELLSKIGSGSGKCNLLWNSLIPDQLVKGSLELIPVACVLEETNKLSATYTHNTRYLLESGAVPTYSRYVYTILYRHDGVNLIFQAEGGFKAG
jgi:hypothetical protein